jgi:predicted PurR-regulated permease PerM
MGFLDRFRKRGHENSVSEASGSETPAPSVVQIDAAGLSRVFSAPIWVRDLGLLAWFLVGVGLLFVGLTWLFAITSSITIPVILGGVIASVAAPLVSSLHARRVPRAVGGAAVVLGLIALGILILALVLGGIVEQSSEIKSALSEASDEIESWLNDAGANGTSDTQADVEHAVSSSGTTLLTGLAAGIAGLTSVVLMLTFTVFSLFFLLKDGPQVRSFIDRHLGVPREVATTITGNVILSLRRYFFGVTIVATFNGVVIGLTAYILGVPLWGTIAVVTFVTAYVPFIGAFVAGALAVLLTLAAEGTTDAAIMLVMVILANGLLQNIVQPIAFGATLDLNPLVVLIATIGFGSLFGMVGLILGAPLTSAALHISRDLAAAKAAAAAAAEAAAAGTAPSPEPAGASP